MAEPGVDEWMAAKLQEFLPEICEVLGIPRATITVNKVKEGTRHWTYAIRPREDRREYAYLRIPLDEVAGRLVRRGTSLIAHAMKYDHNIVCPPVLMYSDEYTVIQRVNGRPMVWDQFAKDFAQRYQILDDLSLLMVRMWMIRQDEPDTPDRKHLSGPREWLVGQVDKALCRSLVEFSPNSEDVWGDPIHYLHRRMKVREVLPGPIADQIPKHRTTPRHAGIREKDILVYFHQDRDLYPYRPEGMERCSGVVGWDTAELVPLAAAVQYPLFIADIPGLSRASAAEARALEGDRRYLVSAVRRRFKYSDYARKVAALLETARERQFFELSLFDRQVNVAYIQQRLGSPPSNAALLEELDRFEAEFPPDLGPQQLTLTRDLRARLEAGEPSAAPTVWS